MLKRSSVILSTVALQAFQDELSKLATVSSTIDLRASSEPLVKQAFPILPYMIGMGVGGVTGAALSPKGERIKGGLAGMGTGGLSAMALSPVRSNLYYKRRHKYWELSQAAHQRLEKAVDQLINKKLRAAQKKLINLKEKPKAPHRIKIRKHMDDQRYWDLRSKYFNRKADLSTKFNKKNDLDTLRFGIAEGILGAAGGTAVGRLAVKKKKEQD